MIWDPVRYAPVPADVPLPTAPRLESWDAAGSASQAALRAYLRELERVAAPLVAAADGPFALALDVALPTGTDLLDERDLDNYLLPAARHLTKVIGRRFVSVSGTKRHGATSYFGIGRACAAGPAALGEATGRARRRRPELLLTSSRSPMRFGTPERSRRAQLPSTSCSASVQGGRGSTCGSRQSTP